MRYARWSLDALATPGERAAAWLIDTAVFWVVWVAGMILLIESGELGDPPRLTAPRALVWVGIVWALSRCYDALSISRWGSTAGRRVLGVEVRDRADATETAIRRAGLGPADAGWLRAVAAQTPTRLDVAAPSWRRGDDPLATRHRAFCLLLAALIVRYPDHRDTLVRVIEQHAALDDVHGNRERHLMALLDDADGARRWLGLPETARVRVLVDAPAGPGGVGQSGTRPRR